MKRLQTLLHEGGLPTWFVLALGIVTLLGAIGFAVRPHEAKRRVLRPLARSTAWATIVACALDVGTTLRSAGSLEMALDRRVQIVLVGLGESLAPLAMGGALLAMVALLMALGNARRRSMD